MFEFKLPDVGEGVAEGELVRWLVEPGDTVAEDEVLAEVETDKAVVDLPAPKAGTIVELHAEAGEVVPVGDVVVTIDTGDGDGESEPGADETAPEPESERQAAASENGETPESSAKGGRVFAPPNVRRLARELGVDVASVAGSGPGGRVTEGDVRDAASRGGSDDADVASAVSSVDTDSETDESEGPTSAIQRVSDDSDQLQPKSAVSKRTATHEGTEATERERTLAAPATRRLAAEEGVDLDAVPTETTRDGEAFVEPGDVRAYAEAQQAAQQADAAAVGEATASATEVEEGPDAGSATADTERVTTAEGDVTREPYRGIRRTIGQHMEESVYTAPHVSHHDTAVVEELVETRAELKPRAEERGISLTYLPFVVKAVVAGLQQFPVLNTSLDEDSEEVVYKHYYNVGVATATDAGLMVPVVENVDEKGILEIAAEIGDLTERARERDLDREEMQGGTFSVTNFGAIGGEYATPIINYPETAILGLGSLQQRPVVADGEVVARHTLPLSLSIDHRVIDGAEAAQFVNTVIEYLEDPRLLLLE
ncbi:MULTISPECIES: dihydrolipoamide acetyltransferase family protein [Salinibaculum]|uniref:dihydrolipoamide acetyltransferase family protein n=1 Tax=Salinibaculum TaxID=2732368 RepID=UPI0030CF39EB